MNKNIQGDFRICISVPLNVERSDSMRARFHNVVVSLYFQNIMPNINPTPQTVTTTYHLQVLAFCQLTRIRILIYLYYRSVPQTF